MAIAETGVLPGGVAAEMVDGSGVKSGVLDEPIELRLCCGREFDAVSPVLEEFASDKNLKEVFQVEVSGEGWKTTGLKLESNDGSGSCGPWVGGIDGVPGIECIQVTDDFKKSGHS